MAVTNKATSEIKRMDNILFVSLKGNDMFSRRQIRVMENGTDQRGIYFFCFSSRGGGRRCCSWVTRGDPFLENRQTTSSLGIFPDS
jgi:hypothetical protein